MALSLQRYMEPDPNSQLIQLLKERSKKEREGSMAIAIEIENGYCFDEGVIVEILSWLPVKYLLQYKTVCKSWHAIISSSDFISKHINNYYRNNNDEPRVLLAQYPSVGNPLVSFVILMDETPRVLAVEDMVDIPMYKSFICGPCDGLYYLYDYFNSKRALWNPSINELRVLPPLLPKSDPFSDRNSIHFEVYGLGFDSISGDYKAIVIQELRLNMGEVSQFIRQSVIVYSLRNDCWTHCGDLCRYYKLQNNKSYNFVNGCYYWLESDYVYEVDKTSYAIICFNLSTNGFEEINLPDYKKPASASLGIFNDSLALLCFQCDASVLEIWTLTEGIWSMKFGIGPLLNNWSPVNHWKDNKLILESCLDECRSWNLVLFDAESQDIKDLSFEYIRPCYGMFVFRESLVSVKGERNWEEVEDNTAAENSSSPIETEESDSEFGIRELFGCAKSESDSEFGILELFGCETSESDSEFGVQDLFCHEV